MPDEQNPNKASLEGILTLLTIIESEIRAMLGLCLAIGRVADIEKIDGLPLLEWYIRHLSQELQKTLEREEDRDPAIAAVIQQRVDDWQRLFEEHGI
jgi:hypothetical protein